MERHEVLRQRGSQVRRVRARRHGEREGTEDGEGGEEDARRGHAGVGVYRDRGGEGDVVEDAFVDVDVVAIVNVDRGDGPAVQVAGAVHDRVNDYVDVDGGKWPRMCSRTARPRPRLSS